MITFVQGKTENIKRLITIGGGQKKKAKKEDVKLLYVYIDTVQHYFSSKY